jgi:uncharacterized protein YdcH (DUF465 family)
LGLTSADLRRPAVAPNGIGRRQTRFAKAMLTTGRHAAAGLPPINQRRCSMPVTHDLYQDLSCSKEDIQQRRANDPHLNALFDKYSSIDDEVLKAEAAAAADDDLKKLKEKRLLIKDEIFQKITAHS